MDNPNVNVRRHTSLQQGSVGSRATSFLLRMSHKSNPYVGTFRHSPPTRTIESKNLVINGSSATSTTVRSRSSSVSSMLDATLKKSRSCLYNNCSSPALSRTLSEEFCRLLLIEAASCRPRKVGCTGLHRIQDLLVSGSLRGGAGGSDLIADWPQLQRTLQRQSTQSQSGTVQVLSRLAYWFLRPFQHEDVPIKGSRHPYHHDLYYNYDENSSMVTDSVYDTEDEDDASILSGTQQSSSRYYGGSSAVISSQAEAYYAHQATSSTMKDVDFMGSSTSASASVLAEEDRLDYNITQVDIIRMMRNASRHLDVDSIVQLPVITYQKEGSGGDAEHDEAPKGDDDADQDMSWLLVPNERQKAEENSRDPASNSNNGDDQDVCVICLEHFCHGDRLRVLPCQHSFHVGCIDRWLSGSHSFHDCVTTGCPTCKKSADVNLQQGDAADAAAAAAEYTVIDGSVPSCAFARIGESLLRGSSLSSSSS